MADYSLSAPGVPGVALTDVYVSMPLAGCWYSDVICADSATDALAVGMDVTLSLSSLQLNGNILRSGQIRGSECVRIVGGAGGLGKKATPRGYQNAPASLVIGDLLSDAGEQLSGSVDGTLGQWMVLAEPISYALSRVADELGLTWRMQPDGTIWMGVDSFPSVSLTNPAFLGWEPERACVHVGIDSPELLPGQSAYLDVAYPPGTMVASTVVYRIHGSGKQRMDVYTVEPS